MNYNNNYPYYQQSYNNYGYQQPQYQQQAYQQQTYQTQAYHPLTYVNGLIGAQAFIVNPGQTYYLMDSDSNTLFIKTADAQGKYALKSFNLIPTESNSGLGQKAENSLKNYVTKEDLAAFKDEIINAIKGVTVDEQ